MKVVSPLIIVGNKRLTTLRYSPLITLGSNDRHILVLTWLFIARIWLFPLVLKDLLFALILHSFGPNIYLALLQYLIWRVREKKRFLFSTDQSKILVMLFCYNNFEMSDRNRTTPGWMSLNTLIGQLVIISEYRSVISRGLSTTPFGILKHSFTMGSTSCCWTSSMTSSAP